MTYKTLIYFITLLFISSYYTIRKNYKNEYEIESFLSGGIQASGNSSRTESVKYGIFLSVVTILLGKITRMSMKSRVSFLVVSKPLATRPEQSL